MNNPTLTPDQQWIVAGGEAKIVNPFTIPTFDEDYNKKHKNFEVFINTNIMQTNAPAGTYPGEAFEVIEQAHSNVVGWFNKNEDKSLFAKLRNTRLFLSLKPAYLPATLSEQAYQEWDNGGELKELYKAKPYQKGEVSGIGLLEYRLSTPPAGQEVETVDEVREITLAGLEYKQIIHEFSAQMLQELINNHHKGGRNGNEGWLRCSPKDILGELYYHVGKIQEAVKYNDLDKVIEYTADVANVSLILRDIVSPLTSVPFTILDYTLKKEDTLQADNSRLKAENEQLKEENETLQHKVDTAKGLFEQVLSSTNAAIKVINHD